MPLKIYSLDSFPFPAAETPWGKIEKVKTDDLLPLLLTPSVEEDSQKLLLLPKGVCPIDTLQTFFSCGSPLSVAFLDEEVDLEILKTRYDFFAIKRKAGIKGALEKGSTIFSETFFHAGNVGAALDPLYRFALEKLGQKKSVDTWAALQSAVYLALRSLPNQGANGTGERVEVQVGCDSKNFCFSLNFDLGISDHKNVCYHPTLNILREAMSYFETRFYYDSNKLEILAFVELEKKKPGPLLEVHAVRSQTGLETNNEAKEFDYKTFQQLSGISNEDKRVFKGKFKKKFSETVAISAAAPSVLDEVKIKTEKVVDAENGNFLVKGEAFSEKSTSSGAEKTPTAEKDKSVVLLESKIQSLEASVKQRDELVAKLNKEIEEIKDPMKMGVITNIKDSQLEGLKDNIKRLEAELTDSQGREKELMSVVDKAIVVKDDATKKVKDLETKLRQLQGGNNSKVVTLERQLEEAKKQNKDLLKKITSLTEQIQASGKKVA